MLVNKMFMLVHCALT